MRIFYIITIAIFSMSLRPCFASDDDKELTVSMHKLEPFVFVKNGNVDSGFVVDIFNAMAKKVGYRGEVQHTTFVRGIRNLEMSSSSRPKAKPVNVSPYHAHLIVVRTKMRNPKFKWVGPLMYDGTVLYQRADDPREFKSLDELKRNNVLCTVKRKVSDSETFTDLGLSFYETDSQEQAILMLVNSPKRVDCTPIAVMNTKEILEQINVKSSQLKPMIFQLPAHPVYMAFSLSTPESIISKWRNALHELDKSGQRLKMIQKYVPAYTTSLESKLKSSIKYIFK